MKDSFLDRTAKVSSTRGSKAAVAIKSGEMDCHAAVAARNDANNHVFICCLLFLLLVLTSACEGPRREINRPVVETVPVTSLHTRDCPNWRDGEHNTNYGNTVLPNFGCATSHNIGQVLENPDDYVNGKGYPGTADAQRATAIFEVYREPASDLSAPDASTSAVEGN